MTWHEKDKCCMLESNYTKVHLKFLKEHAFLTLIWRNFT
jgi:hypothetical protein